MAKRLGIGTQDLGTSQAIRNVDGTPNVGGELTWYTNLHITQEDIEEIQRFYVTNLARIRRYLGCPGYRPSSQISTGEKDKLEEDP